MKSISDALFRAADLRELVSNAALTGSGSGYAVFGDLAAIDELISDLERIALWLKANPTLDLPTDREKELAKMLERLEGWISGLESGIVRPGELSPLD